VQLQWKDRAPAAVTQRRPMAFTTTRANERSLVLHFLFFKDEIRDFDAIAKGEGVKLPAEQLELGMSLIEKMFSPDFEPERYADEYRERARSMVEQKVKGQKSKPSRRRRGAAKSLIFSRH